MNIAFYVDEMNLRGVANSSFQYAFYNEKILKNKSIIFFNKKNHRNKKQVILKFKKKFKVIGVNKFREIDLFKNKLKLNYIYTQKSGEKDDWISSKIKTLVHHVYPQKLSQIHGFKYVCVSKWHSEKFSNNKIPYLPYIVKTEKTKSNLKKKLKLDKKKLVLGCHGGESSFDLKFVQDALIEIVNKRNDIVFIFLNINKFINHPQIIFLKGSQNEKFKKNFINTCDAMIYGRSLGESFGLACGEFAVNNKRILTYKFNRHRSHIKSLPKNMYFEYSSKKSLVNYIENFNKNEKLKINKKENFYLKFTPIFVMREFKKVFFSNHQIKKLSLIDYTRNYLSHLGMGYYYLRHKFYQNYYNLLKII